ncbi:hypothetical protein ACOME3_000042 [Neoechinorhynchus agilis]
MTVKASPVTEIKRKFLSRIIWHADKVRFNKGGLFSEPSIAGIIEDVFEEKMRVFVSAEDNRPKSCIELLKEISTNMEVICVGHLFDKECEDIDQLRSVIDLMSGFARSSRFLSVYRESCHPRHSTLVQCVECALEEAFNSLCDLENAVQIKDFSEKLNFLGVFCSHELSPKLIRRFLFRSEFVKKLCIDLPNSMSRNFIKKLLENPLQFRDDILYIFLKSFDQCLQKCEADKAIEDQILKCISILKVNTEGYHYCNRTIRDTIDSWFNIFFNELRLKNSITAIEMEIAIKKVNYMNWNTIYFLSNMQFESSPIQTDASKYSQLFLDIMMPFNFADLEKSYDFVKQLYLIDPLFSYRSEYYRALALIYKDRIVSEVCNKFSNSHTVNWPNVTNELSKDILKCYRLPIVPYIQSYMSEAAQYFLAGKNFFDGAKDLNSLVQAHQVVSQGIVLKKINADFEEKIIVVTKDKIATIKSLIDPLCLAREWCICNFIWIKNQSVN